MGDDIRRSTYCNQVLHRCHLNIDVHHRTPNSWKYIGHLRTQTHQPNRVKYAD